MGRKSYSEWKYRKRHNHNPICRKFSRTEKCLASNVTSLCFICQFNVKGQRRVSFDNCYQKSFVTNDANEQLKFSIIKSENLSVKVFGWTKTNLEKFDVVQLKIQSCSSSNFKIIEAIVVPTICSHLSGQFIELAKNCYAHLNNMQLSKLMSLSEPTIIRTLWPGK